MVMGAWLQAFMRVMARGTWLQAFMRVEVLLMVGLITLLVVMFFRNIEDTFYAVEKFKQGQIKAAMASSVRNLHIVWLAKGGHSGEGRDIWLGDKLLQLNVRGWPVAVGEGSQVVEVTDSGCLQLLVALLADKVPVQRMATPDGADESRASVIKVAHFPVNALAVGPVCVYQIGDEGQGRVSLLYNTDSGEVRTEFHNKTPTP